MTDTEQSDSPRTVSVRVVLSVEVDGQAWGEVYGGGGWPTDLRAQVKDYITDAIAGSAAAVEGAIVAVDRRS